MEKLACIILYHIIFILPKAVQQQPVGCNSTMPTCHGWSHWLGLSHQDQTGIQGIQVETYENLKYFVRKVYQVKIHLGPNSNRTDWNIIL